MNTADDFVVSVLKSKYGSVPRRWIGETGSAVGSGQDGLSNAFADGFEYLDKLGRMAANGVSSINRQTLCGYHYGITFYNRTSGKLEIKPSYFTTVLWKRLVGKNVYNVDVSGDDWRQSGRVRVYAFSSKEKSATDTVLIAINMLSETASVKIDLVGSKSAVSSRQDYILTSSDGDLSSPLMDLNGVTIVDKGTGALPSLSPKTVTTNPTSIELPARSYGFILI